VCEFSQPKPSSVTPVYPITQIRLGQAARPGRPASTELSEHGLGMPIPPERWTLLKSWYDKLHRAFLSMPYQRHKLRDNQNTMSTKSHEYPYLMHYFRCRSTKYSETVPDYDNMKGACIQMDET
jgi:hypothetical protein